MAQRFTSATCTECNTTFDHVPVEYDGAVGYAVLETTVCGECGVALCPCCAQAKCVSCDQTICQSHLSHVSEIGMCCSECVSAFQAQEDAEPALCCPMCLGTDLRAERYDFIERETGYHDAGERYECRSCGSMGEADELVPVPLPTAKPMGAALAAVPELLPVRREVARAFAAAVARIA
jgi:hypothetical protein